MWVNQALYYLRFMAITLARTGFHCYNIVMKIDIKNLPSDLVLCHQIIIDLVGAVQELREEVKELKAQNVALRTQNALLQTQIVLLQRKVYGKSSEKLAKNQAVETEEETDDEAEDESDTVDDVESSTIPSNKKKPKRQKLPEHLPRERVVLRPPSICPECGGDRFRQIGEDTAEMLEYVPASFKVIEYIRPRCVCILCEKIVQAYPPSNPISKGKAGSGLLAHILIQKYCDHLPLYRQSQIYAREGIYIARSTMASWASQIATLLEPLVDCLRESIFSSRQIHGDDTTVKVLDPGLGKTKTGRLWTYVRDGRPYGDNTPPAVCYFYSPDRKGARPREHLKDFKGILHADAYSGYDKVYEKNITEAACWAHTRRKFYDITVASDNAKIAYTTLIQIAEIYKIEEGIKGLVPDRRQKIRQEKSKKLVDDLFAGFKIALTKLPNKSATTKAINYAMNNKAALMRFLDDGKIEIDNNAAERAMRGIALGRKNWLFAGSDNGGCTAATIYSLTETAKLNNINPQAYLAKVLAMIQDHTYSKLAELLPWNLHIPQIITPA